MLLTYYNNRFAWIEVQGTRYKTGTVVIYAITDDMPEVCLVADVLADNVGTYFLVLKQLSAPEYYSHYHAYTVDKRSHTKTIICRQQDLCDHHSYSLYQSFDPMLIMHHFFVPKYHIIN